MSSGSASGGQEAALGGMVVPEPPSQESSASNKQPTRQSAHKISWDEEIIAEHDKERGTRMKVQEPETPFLYYNPEGDEVYGVGARTENVTLADRWDEITAKLEHIQRMNPNERLDIGDGDGEHARKFASKRAAHYDEYKRLKQWREQRPAVQVDEEDDDA